jgi:hypothetical protein
MMGLMPQMRLLDAALSPCANAPSITTISLTTDELLACGGGSSGWHLVWTINITGSLQAGQEYYWEHKVQQGSWVYWGRGTAASKDYYDQTIGSDALGLPKVDRYHQVRAYVVPEGESPPDNCNAGLNEPVESSEAHEFEKTCAA